MLSVRSVTRAGRNWQNNGRETEDNLCGKMCMAKNNFPNTHVVWLLLTILDVLFSYSLAGCLCFPGLITKQEKMDRARSLLLQTILVIVVVFDSICRLEHSLLTLPNLVPDGSFGFVVHWTLVACMLREGVSFFSRYGVYLKPNPSSGCLETLI